MRERLPPRASGAIPVSFRDSWGSPMADDYRWRLEVRSPDGSTQWSRTFEKLDLKSSAAIGSGRLAVLLHDPKSSILYLAIYRRSP